MAWTTTTTRVTGTLITATIWNNEVVENMKHLQEVTRATNTTSAVINTTTAATSVLIVAASAITTVSGINYDITIECPAVSRTETATGGPSVFIGLYDSGTAVQSKLVQLQAGGTGGMCASVHRTHRVAGDGASHTYQVRGYANTADDWTALASASSGDNFGPNIIRINRVVPT